MPISSHEENNLVATEDEFACSCKEDKCFQGNI